MNDRRMKFDWCIGSPAALVNTSASPIPTLVDAVSDFVYLIIVLVDALDSLLTSGLAQWIGGGIVTLIFYFVARQDARQEAKQLKRLNMMMMNAMEGAG